MVVVEGLEYVLWCGVQLSSGMVPYGRDVAVVVGGEGGLVEGFGVVWNNISTDILGMCFYDLPICCQLFRVVLGISN